MTRDQSIKLRQVVTAIALCFFISFVTWRVSRPADSLIEPEPKANLQQDDSNPENEGNGTDLVRKLLRENLSTRRFDFPTIVEASSGQKVIPLNRGRDSHQRVIAAIRKALDESTTELSQADSPIRKLRRINEGSRYFEEALMSKVSAIPGLTCEVPPNRDGEHQRSGYPDLRIVDEISGDVFYLDPKLVEQRSWRSSFRSFYFEPKTKTLKINDDAVHLLVGIGHDGKAGEWTFGEWNIVDLSALNVRLKAEFQASNADLYQPEKDQ